MTPNPGSDEAIAQGCKCPVLDNGHGRRGGGKGPFWISESCPIRGDDLRPPLELRSERPEPHL